MPFGESGLFGGTVMDARSERIAVPLAVDLDGTLIATDLLWESLFLLIREKPLYLFLLPYWLWQGRAVFKCEIAERVNLDPAALPYREALLARLREEREAGRRIILATAAPRKFAERIAEHLGLFDLVICTNRACNMASDTKRQALTELFGDGGYDYAGNGRADIPVFDSARRAIVVAPDRHAAGWHARHGGELIVAPELTLKTLARMVRVHQWVKNALIFVPVVLAHQYFNLPLLLDCLLAFMAFSAAASAIYILNDFFDLANDRRHPTKRNRPFASGALPIPFGLAVMVVLLAVSAVTAFFLPPLFAGVLGLYLICTTAYSIAVKRMLLLDVLTLAGLYTLRILAGCAATDIAVSFWLLAFSTFFFLSLALVKRYVELRSIQLPVGERIAGRGYRTEDQEIIGNAGMAAAFSSALVLALYMQSGTIIQLYEYPWLIWPLSPIVLYLTMRIWILARRDELHDDPIVFIIRDWRSQMFMAFGAVLLFAAGL